MIFTFSNGVQFFFLLLDGFFISEITLQPLIYALSKVKNVWVNREKSKSPNGKPHIAGRINRTFSTVCHLIRVSKLVWVLTKQMRILRTTSPCAWGGSKKVYTFRTNQNHYSMSSKQKLPTTEERWENFIYRLF